MVRKGDRVRSEGVREDDVATRFDVRPGDTLDDLVASPVSAQQEEPNSDALKALKDLKKS